MAKNKTLVTVSKTGNRREGVKASLKALKVNPVRGKEVLIKPNFNTADVTPGSTHNETLAALVEELWGMGAKSISLGERSYPPTREIMKEKGILPILDKLNFEQEQIARAAELGIGVSSASEIELIPADETSKAYRDQVAEILQKG